MVRKWCELVPFYFRATATVPFFFCFSPTAKCSTFFSSRQWRVGSISGASAQHWKEDSKFEDGENQTVNE